MVTVRINMIMKLFVEMLVCIVQVITPPTRLFTTPLLTTTPSSPPTPGVTAKRDNDGLSGAVVGITIVVVILISTALLGVIAITIRLVYQLYAIH